ncbi:CYTH domain-containing protein [Psychroflexus planctonicus]|uniref:CYTH domain-containing protein n=1 Tax=Psychroflexus planctonicus TaxID=1526575 RepID=A0ABQ1SGK4_9FLAO|nr:CYTH domain-containing protein [Psychroflexus planctonicus]GGE38589.1 CYTH domain-containing protein [Psychroflexus planctonicus]
MQEIERKFLVNNLDFKKEASSSNTIRQAFISRHPERTVRVRQYGNRAFLTIKGKSSEDGTTRMEWEKEITIAEAKQLFAVCEDGEIHKERYLVQLEDFTFEVDEFFGENKGLIIAEIELSSANQAFPKPAWLGKEVTGDVRFYNSQLSKNPFSGFSDEIYNIP